MAENYYNINMWRAKQSGELVHFSRKFTHHFHTFLKAVFGNCYKPCHELHPSQVINQLKFLTDVGLTVSVGGMLPTESG
jgi:hypothetical protein